MTDRTSCPWAASALCPLRAVLWGSLALPWEAGAAPLTSTHSRLTLKVRMSFQDQAKARDPDVQADGEGTLVPVFSLGPDACHLQAGE